MKRHITTLAVVLLLAGCGTLYKSTVLLTTAEDAVMKAWAQAHNDHLTTPALDVKVMNAHEKFNQAKVVAKVALYAWESGGDKNAYIVALEAARAAVGPLLELLAPVLAPNKIEQLKTNVALATRP
jgi:hypothetical protein